MEERKYTLKEIISKDEIEKRVKEIAEQITKDYEGKELLIVGMLKGATTFLSDLIFNIKSDKLTIDFISVAKYDSKDDIAEVKVIKDLDQPLEGKNLIIVEDILDTGKVMLYFKERLAVRHPESIKICTFIDIPSRRDKDIVVDYKGYTIDDKFIVGYGIDYNEKHRNLQNISELIFE